MENTQIWQSDGLGTSARTLHMVTKEFRENGVQGIQSNEALTAYMKRLSEEEIETMMRIDQEATLQILVDTEGAQAALKRICKINVKNHEKICQEYEERVKKEQEATDDAERRLCEALRKQEKLEEEKELIKFKIIELKAKLYDAYEAMNEPTDKNMIKGDIQPCRARTEKTPSGSLERLPTHQKPF